MFERRLKVILALLFVVTGIMVLRAMYLQVVMRDEFADRAEKAMIRPQWVETVRGRIVDLKGRVVASDVASTDACVDYRAVLRPERTWVDGREVVTPADPRWVRDQAIDRLRARLGPEYRKATGAQRKEMIADETEQVMLDVAAMWERLAEVSQLPGETHEQAVGRIDEVRQSIIARVEMRRRYLWYRNYEKAVERHETNAEEASLWQRWLLDPTAATPEVDKFIITVAEQLEPHVVLRAIDPLVAAELSRDAERYPGLVLRPSTTRFYPFHETAAHVLGHISRVNAEDLKTDPNRTADGNELKQYYPNDLIGRTGIESLAEPALRGTRGQIRRRLGDDGVLSDTPAVAGQDVRLSIDMDLQHDVEQLFKAVPIEDYTGANTTTPMYGAAVVIDVATGQVRVLASNPGFDPNTLDEQFGALMSDELNRPMLNRATHMALEPGSTVKPIVGLSAITAGLLGAREGIECNGYLMIGGRKQPSGRCWTASKFGNRVNPNTGAPYPVAHHQIPYPHKGHDGYPDGHLSYSDALERSCNVFFETVADEMGMESLSTWYDRWGLGRPTGLGIAEARGLLPRLKNVPALQRKMTTWFAGIGQGSISATPIQMANVAATIARGGVWKRPRLIAPDEQRPFDPQGLGADEVDLKLSPAGLAEARDGMLRVVNSRAGTGVILVRESKVLRNHVMIAGKTGTAQAAKFSVVLREPGTNKILRDPETGKIRRQFFEPLNDANPTGMAWYRGSGHDHKDLAHAWYIGFAPADRPRIAFCVFVEYGGSGGVAAAPIATGMLEACVKHGYLPTDADNSVGMVDAD